jgi:hypothetical protein
LWPDNLFKCSNYATRTFEDEVELDDSNGGMTKVRWYVCGDCYRRLTVGDARSIALAWRDAEEIK